MEVIESVDLMRRIRRRLACESKAVRFVPTMGCLHAGHGQLIKQAIEEQAEKQVDMSEGTNGDQPDSRPIIVVSIFVNPLQFNDRDDFDKYPVTVTQDLTLCKELGVDYVFMPNSRELLGEFESAANRKSSTGSRSSKAAQSSQCITLKLPDELAQDLEGKSRPNHFEGMLTIVCKLFNIVQPCRAYFGEKDYQQLVLVTKMVRDLNIGTKIRPVATVREGLTNLPLSSRNGRLSGSQKRAAASIMYGVLEDSKKELESKCRRSMCEDSNESQPTIFKLETVLLSVLLAAQTCALSTTDDDEDQVNVDYFEIRCAKDLSVIEFNQALNLYDCQRGCVRWRISKDNGIHLASTESAKILEARLLISVIVAHVRLLDNMDVCLNL